MSKAEAKINQEMLMLANDQTPGIGASLGRSKKERKLISVAIKPYIPDLNAEPCSDSEGEEIEENHFAPRLYLELQVEIFARVSCFEYWKMLFLNKQFSHFLNSGEIFWVRQERGLVKPYVFMLTSGNTRWTIFDKEFQNIKTLPEIPSDGYCFIHSEKKKQFVRAHTCSSLERRQRALWCGDMS